MASELVGRGQRERSTLRSKDAKKQKALSVVRNAWLANQSLIRGLYWFSGNSFGVQSHMVDPLTLSWSYMVDES